MLENTNQNILEKEYHKHSRQNGPGLTSERKKKNGRSGNNRFVWKDYKETDTLNAIKKEMRHVDEP